jgi:hypothetical protein
MRHTGAPDPYKRVNHFLPPHPPLSGRIGRIEKFRYLPPTARRFEFANKAPIGIPSLSNFAMKSKPWTVLLPRGLTPSSGNINHRQTCEKLRSGAASGTSPKVGWHYPQSGVQNGLMQGNVAAQ